MNKKKINSIIEASDISPEDIVFLLSLTDKGDVGLLRQAAYDLTTSILGNKVHYRGIVEFSNICVNDCFYCGIRKNNKVTERYLLSEEEVIKSALWSASSGYGSCVLQSGERHDEHFVSFVERCISEIKRQSRSNFLPDGLGITLSVGEQTPEVYKRFFDAGAHRYLMRIETSNPILYAKLHPEELTFENRLASLVSLRETGYQVGTGVMIGIPGQTIEDLANDILFFRDHDIDMIGMGPYIMHHESPMRDQGMMDKEALLQLSLNMIAVTRLVLRDVNIAATTALQALVYDGRELGISYGANVVMPNLTPQVVRVNYQLYEGKPCINEGRDECRSCLQRRVESTGRIVGWNEYGDPRHFYQRN